MSGPSLTSRILAFPLLILIQVYRYTLSPIFGNSCRFYPTCSHYAEEALRRYGVLKGCALAAGRLLRCHPWHQGGYDPVE
ncbi:MAG: membrane protein insertion efficiency factor YidD [Candidatus Zixiibacteriota bacterium]|nr:MAG: membrane protein insertion efficiency factor YidD [candidate division Zixibacteria bacterium]